MKNKAAKIWFVNILSFISFSVLTITGLISWLLLPKGYGAASGFLVSIRHFLREIDEWTALLFIVIVMVHLVMHWAPIIKWETS